MLIPIALTLALVGGALLGSWLTARRFSAASASWRRWFSSPPLLIGLTAIAAAALYWLSGDEDRAARLVATGTVLAAVYAAFAAWAAMRAATTSTNVTGYLATTLAGILQPELLARVMTGASDLIEQLQFVEMNAQGVVDVRGTAVFKKGSNVEFSFPEIEGVRTSGRLVIPGPGGGYPVPVDPPRRREDLVEIVATGWDRGRLVKWKFRTYLDDNGDTRYDDPVKLSEPRL